VQSEGAAALLAELQDITGGKLCVRCASIRLQTDRDTVLKHIRELITTGHVICGQFPCSYCRGIDLVAFLRPFGYPPRVA
jgi:hypothetical protein